MGEMIALYGDSFVDWCKLEGFKEFDKWAEKNGYEFLKVQEKDTSNAKNEI